MIPTWINPLTCDDVDARLLLVINMDTLNNFLSEKISFPCKNLGLVKKEIVARGGKVIPDSFHATILFTTLVPWEASPRRRNAQSYKLPMHGLFEFFLLCCPK